MGALKKLASSGPALWLHWANPMNFIAGLFPATVASLSFVNYGGKFRLEWMSTSERAECFCPVWQLSQTKICWRVDTYEADAADP